MQIVAFASGGILDSIDKGITTIAKGVEYLLHPTWIFIDLWNGLVEISASVCLIGAMACIVLYAMGYKKFGKGITLSFIIYIFIQAIGVIAK
ncbi:hypothetical protein 10S11_57 [uncultured Caudovirales phage]|uniref:Uncharacterized protein n=1 Tax=uncultured Caudovirales phage TaxID=2100421 RepID=A0A2H4J1Q9_9CAUD|nr:hypothetical protein 10S11_57 [uncultured Caudovirales phage]